MLFHLVILWLPLSENDMIETQPTPTQQTTSTNMVVYQPQSLVPDEPMGDPMGNPMNNDSTDNPPAYESIFLDDSTVGNETHATEDQPESALEEVSQVPK